MCLLCAALPFTHGWSSASPAVNLFAASRTRSLEIRSCHSNNHTSLKQLRGRLLQHCSCWGTKLGSACVERCCACRHRHLEVRRPPGSEYCTTNFTGLTFLAGVFFKLAVTVHRYLNGRTPLYLLGHCISVSGDDTRRHLRSFGQPSSCSTEVPAQHFFYGRRAFSVADPTVRNTLPDFVRDPTISSDCFRRLIITHFLARC